MDYNMYMAAIRERLDDYRFEHSLCVAEEAKRLAELYGENQDDAYLAGLLHDITKNCTKEEHLQFFSMFDIILTDVEAASEKLWHAMTGSHYVSNVLGVKDPHIISAIRYHTTAKKDMSMFEKIIYLADFTSKDRNYPDVEIMRSLVDKNPDKAMAYSLSFTISNLVKKESVIHPDTLAAYNQVINKLKVTEN